MFNINKFSLYAMQFTILLILYGIDVNAVQVFYDDFNDPLVGPVIYSGIGGSSPTEIGGQLTVSGLSNGQGLSVEWSDTNVNCTRFVNIKTNTIANIDSSDTLKFIWYGISSPRSKKVEINYFPNDDKTEIVALIQINKSNSSQVHRISIPISLWSELGANGIEMDYDHSGFLGLGSNIQIHLESTTTGEKWDSPWYDPPGFSTVGFDIIATGQYNMISIDAIETDTQHGNPVPVNSSITLLFFSLIVIISSIVLLVRMK